MKQWLLRHGRLGKLAMDARDTYELFSVARKHPEAVGTTANDILATKLVTALCWPGRTFVDVGAHIGSIISRVKSQCPGVKIEAIEAIPEKVERLRAAFPNATIHGCAVGNSEGEISFYVNLVASGYSSMLRPETRTAHSVREIRVPLRRLDDVIAVRDIDVMKIDVEGAELEVFQGAASILQTCRPTVMFESGPEREVRCRQLHAYLMLRNYCIVLPNRLGHYDEGLSETGFVESHFYPRRSTNYFAVHRDRRDEVRVRSLALQTH